MIDELSLGLAPVIVDEIIERLPEIAASGTSVLLVDQDVDAALSIAERAYVLETGHVVLSGKAGSCSPTSEFEKATSGSARRQGASGHDPPVRSAVCLAGWWWREHTAFERVGRAEHGGVLAVSADEHHADRQPAGHATRHVHRRMPGHVERRRVRGSSPAIGRRAPPTARPAGDQRRLHRQGRHDQQIAVRQHLVVRRRGRAREVLGLRVVAAVVRALHPLAGQKGPA